MEGLTLFWIEAGSSTVQSRSLSRPMGNTALKEMLIEDGVVEPYEILLVPNDELGGHWFKEQYSKLLQKASS